VLSFSVHFSFCIGDAWAVQLIAVSSYSALYKAYFCDIAGKWDKPLNLTIQEDENQRRRLWSNVLDSVFPYGTEWKVLCFGDYSAYGIRRHLR
jgi:hypothetical protein